MEERKIPVLYLRKEDCCGCTACFAVCTSAAIMMLQDEEGFVYPHINEDICLRCYMCLNVCPVKAATED